MGHGTIPKRDGTKQGNNRKMHSARSCVRVGGFVQDVMQIVVAIWGETMAGICAKTPDMA